MTGQDANFSEMPKISGGITCKPNYQTNTETDFSSEDQIRNRIAVTKVLSVNDTDMHHVIFKTEEDR